MKISEIQRMKSDFGDWQSKERSKTIPNLTPIDDNPRFGYVKMDSKGPSLTGTATRISFFDTNTPENDILYIGYISFGPARVAGLSNTVQISNVVLDSRYRGKGLGLMMYKTVLKLGYTIIADTTQTKSAINLWANLSTIPNVKVNGIFYLMPVDFDPKYSNEFNRDNIKRNILKLKKMKAEPLVNYENMEFNDHVPFTFPVNVKTGTKNKELYAPGVKLYHSEQSQSDDDVTLYAKWIE